VRPRAPRDEHEQRAEHELEDIDPRRRLAVVVGVIRPGDVKQDRSDDCEPEQPFDDLFALPNHRRLGVGGALLDFIRAAAISAGALRLVLRTEADNTSALRLYAESSYTTVEGYRSLTLPLKPDQGLGIGSALMDALLTAADAADVPMIILLGSPQYYSRFGFRPAQELGVIPPEPRWGEAFKLDL
jgi:putative acetyltransferase